MARIGVVCGDPFALEAFADMLRSAVSEEARIWTASSPFEALGRCVCDGRVAGDAPDLLVTDVRMPGMSGMALCRLIRAVDGCMPILALTSYDVHAVEDRMALVGAQCLLGKDDRKTIVAAVMVLLRGGMWRTGPHSLFLPPRESQIRLLASNGRSAMTELWNRCTNVGHFRHESYALGGVVP